MPAILGTILPLLAWLGGDMALRKLIPGIAGSKALSAFPKAAGMLGKAAGPIGMVGGLGASLLMDHLMNSEDQAVNVNPQQINEAELLAMMNSYKQPQLQMMQMLQEQADAGALPDLLNDLGVSDGGVY